MIQTLYVNRPLLNADHLLHWAINQGFKSTLEPHDLHVTVAFSKKPVEWHHITPSDDHLHIEGGHRAISPLGDKGAVVLHFDHPKLHERWQHFIDNGATWDHDGYRPHVTLTYDGGGLPLDRVMPYDGPLIFGPEEFEPLDQNWDQKIQEVPLVIEKRGVSTRKLSSSVKYGESIAMENNRMTELSTLLMKNIDLILEAYNVDNKGNLVVANKRKVAEADNVFHEFFVNNMNQMFRRLNENDPIMQQPAGMGMNPHGHGHDDLGMGNEMMGDMSPMGHPHDMMGGQHHDGGQGFGDEDMMGGGDEMHGGMGGMGGHHMADNGMGGGMGGGGMAGGAMHSGMQHGMGAMGESTDWLFSENVDDIDINGMFDITEDEDGEEGEGEEGEENLNEFGMAGMGQDPMSMGGGHSDFGGDMGGIGGGDDMGGDPMGGDPMGGGDDMMGGDDDMGGMVTIHGETDTGSPFEFKFNPETLGFDSEMSGGGDEHHHGGHEEHHSSEHDGGGDFGGGEPGMGGEEEDEEPQVAEGAAFHNGKPRRGRKGGSSSRMSIVPQNPRASHAAPFPSPQGTRQKH